MGKRRRSALGEVREKERREREGEAVCREMQKWIGFFRERGGEKKQTVGLPRAALCADSYRSPSGGAEASLLWVSRSAAVGLLFGLRND